VKHLRLTIYQPEWLQHPMQRYIAEHDHVERATMVHARQVDEDQERLLFHVAGDRGPYTDALDAVDSVRDYDVTPIDEASFYVYVHQRTRDADRRFRKALDAESLLLVPPVEYFGDGIMRCTIVGEPDHLRRVLDGMPDGVDFDVEHVGEYAPPRAHARSALTERQRAVAETALDLGYYDRPRSATLSEVADAAGCATSTASDHLRKAERRVMQWALEP
jgi:predicted DNA binding protein